MANEVLQMLLDLVFSQVFIFLTPIILVAIVLYSTEDIIRLIRRVVGGLKY